jgi:hypothetical protein
LWSCGAGDKINIVSRAAGVLIASIPSKLSERVPIGLESAEHRGNPAFSIACTHAAASTAGRSASVKTVELRTALKIFASAAVAQGDASPSVFDELIYLLFCQAQLLRSDESAIPGDHHPERTACHNRASRFS